MAEVGLRGKIARSTHFILGVYIEPIGLGIHSIATLNPGFINEYGAGCISLSFIINVGILIGG